MTENTKKTSKAIFWSELALVMIIPISLCWSMIPTNVLNSHVAFKILEVIALGGGILILATGIPLGITGITASVIKSNDMGKLRIPTLVFSIINLSAGIILIVGPIVLLCAVVFGGLSV